MVEITVYVDDMLKPARIGHCRPAKWSHLFADSSTELEGFARRLGLDPRWLQNRDTHREHYDVTATVRARAIREGAVPISYPHDTGMVLARKARAEARR